MGTERPSAARRLPVPGPSFVREETVRLHEGPGHEGRAVRVGMSSPSTTDDGWWLAIVWAADDEGLIDARDVAPRRGPPPGPPLATLGPALGGALSSLVAQENGRQALRVRLPPAAAEDRPWERPLILQVALKWDPVRGAVMRPNELAREVLRAFARAIAAAGRPG